MRDNSPAMYPSKVDSVDLEEVSLGSNKNKRPYSNTVLSDHQGDSGITVKGVICVATLFVINLLNYMDRYTVAGVLNDVKEYYDINDSEAGFLQTVFIIFYMIFAPINGYLGDRYNRKWIMVVGLTIWIFAVLGSSFVPADYFYAFMILRGVVGIGEASYATIAPTIIADLFTGNTRSRVLMVFYFAIPVGSGLGYMVGSQVGALFGFWAWGIRVTPVAGFICILLLVFIIQEPERGQAEKALGANNATAELKSSYWEDIKYLVSIKTFLLSNVGYTLVVFATGTLAWWVPSAIQYDKAYQQGYPNISSLPDQDKANTSLIFGGLTCLGGFLGVSTGIFVSQYLKEGKFWGFKTDKADPLVCGVGSLVAIPFMVGGLHLIDGQAIVGWFCIFLSVTFLSLNWAVVVDILLYVVVPRRRNLASAWQITMSHLFGDASGPYIIGVISDAIRKEDTPKGNFDSLLTAFYLPSVLLLLSGAAFFISATTLTKDKNTFEHAMGYDKSRSNTDKVADSSKMQYTNSFSNSVETSKL